MITDFTLAACAEMIFTELPIAERVRRIDDLGFQVEIWDWTRHDIDGLASTGARFSSMTGYVTGDLIDSDGADELLATAEQSIPVAAKLGVPRLNLHGTGLDSRGFPIKAVEVITGDMWLKAEHTLARIADLGQREGVIFCLENLNTAVDHPGAPARESCRFARVGGGRRQPASPADVGHPSPGRRRSKAVRARNGADQLFPHCPGAARHWLPRHGRTGSLGFWRQ
jgi:hydroxypyruvate isomerase